MLNKHLQEVSVSHLSQSNQKAISRDNHIASRLQAGTNMRVPMQTHWAIDFH